MSSEENKILQLKYDGKQFGAMDAHSIDLTGDALLLRIHAITGWVIPEGALQSILCDQLKKKMSESYANCTASEIEYAFRNYGTMVKDWGKHMNLSLIDEVMIPYLNKRRELSKLEEHQSSKQLLIEVKEDLSDMAMREWCNDLTWRIQNGYNDIDFMPIMIYDWLDKLGKISATKEEKWGYMVKSVEHRKASLIKRFSDDDSEINREELSKFMKMAESGEFCGDEVDRLKTAAKKILLYEMLKSNVGSIESGEKI